MSRLPRAQFSVIALMAALGGGSAAVHAATLPPLLVDPALLGPPPARPLRQAPGVAAVPAAQDASSTPGAVATDTARQSAMAGAGVSGQTAGGVPVPVVPLGSAKDRKTAPVYVTADHVEGKSGEQVVAQGNVDLIKADSQLKADELTYREPEDELEAKGHVYLRRESDEMAGPHLKLKLGESVGFFEEPRFRISPKPVTKADNVNNATVTEAAQPGYGTASRLDFLGEDHYKLSNATYSTCTPGDGQQDWFAKVADLDLNYVTSEGEAHDATVVFKGMPILYSPWLSFSLNRQRKSGLLVPTWGTTTNSGMEFALPYYWNIAPDMDATITPRIMAKRGTQLRGEYRYLGESYQGIVNGEYLPNDQVAHRSRHAFSMVHTQRFSPALIGSLNVSGVSDDTYFTDLSSQLTTIAQTNLVREGRLTYGGGWWSANALVQRFQTLQDPNAATVTPPYERLPQLTLNATRYDLPAGLAATFNGEFVAFSSPTGGTVQGKRTIAYPQLSLPFQTASFYVTPKIGVHNTTYQLEQQAAGTPSNLTRNVPILSVDSGLVFERDTSFFGRNVVQTLEPRFYYLNVPYRDQSQIPVFDTGVADFNFAQIFSENAFTGGDRIADANQATLAATSRLLSPATGGELARVAVGQRWYFRDQLVTLPGVAPRSGHLADYLGALSAQVDQATTVDGAIRYNPRDSRLERFNAGVRYQPATGQILNASYRYNRDQFVTTSATQTGFRLIDLSGQWPLGGGWSAVGRYNYSIRDKRAVENVLGMEYNEACWAVRFVVQKVATTTGNTSSAMFVQLQLNGFSSLGANPSTLLKRNVPGYGRLVEPENEEMIPK